MNTHINPEEISHILEKELEVFNSSAELEEVGTVLQVGNGIVRIYGLSQVQAGERISFPNGLKGLVLNLEENHIAAVVLGPADQVKEGV